MEPVIYIENLCKNYRLYSRMGDYAKEAFLGWAGKHFYNEFKALDNISLTIMPGECIGIVGRNGSGKSTLLQCVAGIIKPTGGSVTVKGRIGALLELGAGFSPDYSGRENIYLYSAILGLKSREIQERLAEIMDFADIGEYIDQPVRTYSSGMYIRLAFAVNACIHPEVLIVDEALSVGDIPFQAKCFRYLRNLAKNGTTIMFVSHDVNTIKNFCGRAIWLMDGKIKMDGNAAETAGEYYNYCCTLAGLPKVDKNIQNIALNASVFFKVNPGNNHIYAALLEGMEAFKKKTDAISSGNGDVCIRNLIFTDANGTIKDTFMYGEEAVVYILIEAKKDLNDEFLLGINLYKIDKAVPFSYGINNTNNISKLVCKKDEFKVLKTSVPLYLHDGGYSCCPLIKGGIDGLLNSPGISWDSNRQICWHGIDNYPYINVLPPAVSFGEDVLFMPSVEIESITGIAEGDKSGTLKAQ